MSIAALERRTGMPLTPHACVLCANNPVDEITGEQQDCIFAPGVDVDWGGSVYICWNCAGIIADLVERVPREEHDELKAGFEGLAADHELLQEKYDKAVDKLGRIAQGRRAERELPGARKKKPVTA